MSKPIIFLVKSFLGSFIDIWRFFSGHTAFFSPSPYLYFEYKDAVITVCPYACLPLSYLHVCSCLQCLCWFVHLYLVCFVFLSICACLHKPLFLHLSPLSLSIYLSLSTYLSLPTYQSEYIYLPISIYLLTFLYLPTSLFISTYLYLSIYLPISTYLPVSIYLPTYLYLSQIASSSLTQCRPQKSGFETLNDRIDR